MAATSRERIDAWLDVWLDVLFPPRCLTPGCVARGAWICARCIGAAPRLPALRCGICGDGVLAAGAGDRRLRCRRCLVHPPAFDLALAPWLHAPPVTSWIHALKYARRRRVAAVAGRHAAAIVRPELGDAPEPIVVVPVPTHPQRRAERGIDVPAHLAAALASSLGLPCAADGLQRVRPTPPQVGTSRARRLANVLDAIAIQRPIRAGTVIVVDDVLTTGATGEACARVLKAGGAATVVIVTAARATNVGRASGAAGGAGEGTQGARGVLRARAGGPL